MSYIDKTIEAKRDQHVTLSCFVEDPPENSQVRWQKRYVDKTGRRQVDLVSQDMAIYDVTKYSIEKPTDSTWRLRIKNIQVYDEAEYVCFIQLTEVAITEDRRMVYVRVPPFFDMTGTSSDTTVLKNGNLDLKCNASGRPWPTVEWTRLGGALLPIGKEKHIGAVLAIKNIQPQDRGRYRCHVWNSIGEIRRDIDVDVKFEPIVTVPVGQRTIYQAPGYRMELQCFVEANPLPMMEEMKWIKSDSGLSFSVSSDRYIIRTLEGAFSRMNYELIIDGVTDKDYGDWTCQIKNSMSLSGPTLGRVSLKRTDTPQDSIKLGQVIRGGEWKTASASATVVSMVTLGVAMVLGMSLTL